MRSSALRQPGFCRGVYGVGLPLRQEPHREEIKRLKRALVTSFVGAIALGWLFAQGILHFANIFSAPIAGWLMRREYRGAMERANTATGFSLQDALPELVRSFSLLLVGIFLAALVVFQAIGAENNGVGFRTKPQP